MLADTKYRESLSETLAAEKKCRSFKHENSLRNTNFRKRSARCVTLTFRGRWYVEGRTSYIAQNPKVCLYFVCLPDETRSPRLASGMRGLKPIPAWRHDMWLPRRLSVGAATQQQQRNLRRSTAKKEQSGFMSISDLLRDVVMKTRSLRASFPLRICFSTSPITPFPSCFSVSLCFSRLACPPAIALGSGTGEIARFVLYLPVSSPRQPLRTVVDAHPGEEERAGREAGARTLFPLLRRCFAHQRLIRCSTE